ncbi:hypothetical protein DFH09DRAFT_1455138 [Mycena vulgaris]|nr:hypothetical protein DFH09DRAFT_1455138 [Mycena vulgaris]
MSCAYHVEPVVKRPKKILTEDEKQDAKMKREINKVLKENRGEWEAMLPAPWVESSTFRHPAGTRLMFKSDAKKAFGLTEGEILTLRHESVPVSPKTYFALADVKALQQGKTRGRRVVRRGRQGYHARIGIHGQHWAPVQGEFPRGLRRRRAGVRAPLWCDRSDSAGLSQDGIAISPILMSACPYRSRSRKSTTGSWQVARIIQSHPGVYSIYVL